jgi:glycosyltransferase involved in cell wall biosynthesis
MKKNITISIVIPSYNQARFLEAAVDSVLKQEHTALEIILIDGGSTDGTRDIIRSYADRLTYWVSEKDRGQSHALNKGFARATGEWLSWLNSDDILLPGAVNALVAAIERNPGASCWTGGGWFIDEKGKRLKHYDPPGDPLSADDIGPWTRNWFAQPGTFMKRDLFDRAGGFVREDLHYAMDLDLWLRMSRIDRLHGLGYDMAAYRLHDDSKTVDWRADMEVEVVRVLNEHLGFERALERVAFLATNHFELEKSHAKFTRALRMPLRLYRMLKKQHG